MVAQLPELSSLIFFSESSEDLPIFSYHDKVHNSFLCSLHNAKILHIYWIGQFCSDSITSLKKDRNKYLQRNIGLQAEHFMKHLEILDMDAWPFKLVYCPNLLSNSRQILKTADSQLLGVGTSDSSEDRASNFIKGHRNAAALPE